MTALGMMYVMLGGAFGSLMRYVVMSLMTRLSADDFPWGTLSVNVIGSFLMGAWIAAMAYTMPAKAKDLHLLFAVGVLGGFTTFSTFSLDIFFLTDRGDMLQVALYICSSLVFSVLALLTGMWLVRLAF